MEGLQCRLSILRNDNVPCRHFKKFISISKIDQCRLSDLGKGHVALSNLGVTYRAPFLVKVYLYSTVLPTATHLMIVIAELSTTVRYG